MKLLEVCPVCQKGPIRKVFEDYSFQVTRRGEQKPLGGLTAFQCTQELHIFFLMTKDVEKG